MNSKIATMRSLESISSVWGHFVDTIYKGKGVLFHGDINSSLIVDDRTEGKNSVGMVPMGHP